MDLDRIHWKPFWHDDFWYYSLLNRNDDAHLNGIHLNRTRGDHIFSSCVLLNHIPLMEGLLEKDLSEKDLLEKDLLENYLLENYLLEKEQLLILYKNFALWKCNFADERTGPLDRNSNIDSQVLDQ